MRGDVSAPPLRLIWLRQGLKLIALRIEPALLEKGETFLSCVANRFDVSQRQCLRRIQFQRNPLPRQLPALSQCQAVDRPANQSLVVHVYSLTMAAN